MLARLQAARLAIFADSQLSAGSFRSDIRANDKLSRD